MKNADTYLEASIQRGDSCAEEVRATWPGQRRKFCGVFNVYSCFAHMEDCFKAGARNHYFLQECMGEGP